MASWEVITQNLMLSNKKNHNLFEPTNQQKSFKIAGTLFLQKLLLLLSSSSSSLLLLLLLLLLLFLWFLSLKNLLNLAILHSGNSFYLYWTINHHQPWHSICKEFKQILLVIMFVNISLLIATKVWLQLATSSLCQRFSNIFRMFPRIFQHTLGTYQNDPQPCPRPEPSTLYDPEFLNHSGVKGDAYDPGYVGILLECIPNRIRWSFTTRCGVGFGRFHRLTRREVG